MIVGEQLKPLPELIKQLGRPSRAASDIVMRPFVGAATGLAASFA